MSKTTKSTEQKKESPLTAEIKVFEDRQPGLQRDNPEGGFVVIKGGEVLGVWRDETDAFGEGVKKYGDEIFLVRDINDTGEPIYFARNIFASA